jgi:hypothetical protein
VAQDASKNRSAFETSVTIQTKTTQKILIMKCRLSEQFRLISLPITSLTQEDQSCLLRSIIRKWPFSTLTRAQNNRLYRSLQRLSGITFLKTDTINLLVLCSGIQFNVFKAKVERFMTRQAYLKRPPAGKVGRLSVLFYNTITQ